MATNIVIIIATLVFTFANFNAWSKFLTSFAIIAVIAAINFFVAESYFKKKSARIYSYIIGFAIAGIFERFVHYNAFGTSIYRILIGYSIVAFLIGLFKVIKNSGLELLYQSFQKFIWNRCNIWNFSCRIYFNNDNSNQLANFRQRL